MNPESWKWLYPQTGTQPIKTHTHTLSLSHHTNSAKEEWSGCEEHDDPDLSHSCTTRAVLLSMPPVHSTSPWLGGSYRLCINVRAWLANPAATTLAQCSPTPNLPHRCGVLNSRQRHNLFSGEDGSPVMVLTPGNCDSNSVLYYFVLCSFQIFILFVMTHVLSLILFVGLCHCEERDGSLQPLPVLLATMAHI